MGIPKFFMRLRALGTHDIIGRNTGDSQSQNKSQDCQTTLAVVDGPSLAHFLYDELVKETYTSRDTECFFRYSILGRKAVKRLDNLCDFGFEIDGIYFDGALPASKRQTRLDRLQKQTESLLKYKQQTSTQCPRRESLSVHRNLPRPPFLVSAVIEALIDSKYSNKTWVVDGEADGFCAAVPISKCETKRNFIIFTNDSDLIIWKSGDNTRVAIIREMKERHTKDGVEMEALCFSPLQLSKLGGRQLPDLVKPAFEMRDSKVTFAQAKTNSDMRGDIEAFARFAAQYNIHYPMMKLVHQRQQRENGQELNVRDPRTSEIIHQYLSGLVRNPAIATDVGCAELAKELPPASHAHNGEYRDVWDLAQAEQEPVDPFDDNLGKIQTNQSSESLSQPAIRLEMFLPALLEDPTKSAAWRVGIMFRNAAETILMLPFDNHESIVLEYKRSGQKIVPRQIHRATIDDLRDNMAASLRYLGIALLVADKLVVRSRWRFLLMQLTLSDVYQENKNLPRESDIICIVNGKPSSEWSTTHLFAQYQAEYYSLRMLRDVLKFCRDRAEFRRLNLPTTFHDFETLLKGLPTIGQFFDLTDPDIDLQDWQTLSDQFVKQVEDSP